MRRTVFKCSQLKVSNYLLPKQIHAFKLRLFLIIVLTNQRVSLDFVRGTTTLLLCDIKVREKDTSVWTNWR